VEPHRLREAQLRQVIAISGDDLRPRHIRAASLKSSAKTCGKRGAANRR
jgi:hypothetical protein